MHFYFNFLIILIKISFTFENQHGNLQGYNFFEKTTNIELNTEVLILKHKHTLFILN